MVIKIVHHFVGSNHGVEMGLTEKEGLKEEEGEFWKLFCLEGRQMIYLGEGRVYLRDQR